MPKRSNEFQALIYRIESALHGSDVIVEESAEVPNETSGKTEEIDVLITHQLGGRTYKTGVAVQYRSRDKGSPSWIRDLSVQRTQLKLDRMVAVHSRGFTKSAAQIAHDLNVQLVSPHEIDDPQLQEALLPVDALILTRFRLHTLGYQSDANVSFPKSASDSLLHISSRNAFDRSNIEDLIHQTLIHCIPNSALTDAERSHLESGHLVVTRFRIPLAPNSAITDPSGTSLPVSHLVGKAEIQWVHARFDETAVLDYSGRAVIAGTDPRFHQKAQLTIVESDQNDLKIEAVVPLEPGDTPMFLDIPSMPIPQLSHAASS